MAFMFELEREDGTPADLPSLSTAIAMWRPGDTIPLGRKTLRVVAILAAQTGVRPLILPYVRAARVRARRSRFRVMTSRSS
jgi:hypothetical protein